MASTKQSLESAKRLAAFTAVDKHILPHHKVCLCFSFQFIAAHRETKVIGIGSGGFPLSCTLFYSSSSPGSTVPYVVERIIAQGSVNANRVFISTGVYYAHGILTLTVHLPLTHRLSIQRTHFERRPLPGRY